MTIIFCDIDGVLNSSIHHKNGYADVELEKLDLLKELVDVLNAKLIITSKIRFDVLMEPRINAIKNMVEVDYYFKGGSFSYESKANECLGYLMNNCPNFNLDSDRIIILDDQDDGFSKCDLLANSFVLINHKTGLTREVVDMILNK